MAGRRPRLLDGEQLSVSPLHLSVLGTPWGVDGFEIWTESARAMDIPPTDRRAVIARCRLAHRAMFGATDLHAFGNAATVWNLARLPGWRSPNTTPLAHALMARFRASGATANRVVALRRWLPETRLGSAFSVPVSLAMLLRTASRWHALVLAGWVWVLAVLRRRPRPAT